MYNPMPPAKRSFPGLTISLLILSVILAVLLGVAANELIRLQQTQVAATVVDVAVDEAANDERRIQRDPIQPTALLERLAFLTKSGATNRCTAISSLLADKVLPNGIAIGSDAFDLRIVKYFDEYLPSESRPVFEDAYAEALSGEGVGVAYICADDSKIAFLIGTSPERVSLFAWRDGQPWVMPEISGVTAPYYISAIDTGYELFVTGAPFDAVPAWEAWRFESEGFENGERTGYQLQLAESCGSLEVGADIEYVCTAEHIFANE